MVFWSLEPALRAFRGPGAAFLGGATKDGPRRASEASPIVGRGRKKRSRERTPHLGFQASATLIRTSREILYTSQISEKYLHASPGVPKRLTAYVGLSCRPGAGAWSPGAWFQRNVMQGVAPGPLRDTVVTVYFVRDGSVLGVGYAARSVQPGCGWRCRTEASVIY